MSPHTQQPVPARSAGSPNSEISMQTAEDTIPSGSTSGNSSISGIAIVALSCIASLLFIGIMSCKLAVELSKGWKLPKQIESTGTSDYFPIERKSASDGNIDNNDSAYFYVDARFVSDGYDHDEFDEMVKAVLSLRKNNNKYYRLRYQDDAFTQFEGSNYNRTDLFGNTKIETAKDEEVQKNQIFNKVITDITTMLDQNESSLCILVISEFFEFYDRTKSVIMDDSINKFRRICDNETLLVGIFCVTGIDFIGITEQHGKTLPVERSANEMPRPIYILVFGEKNRVAESCWELSRELSDKFPIGTEETSDGKVKHELTYCGVSIKNAGANNPLLFDFDYITFDMQKKIEDKPNSNEYFFGKTPEGLFYSPVHYKSEPLCFVLEKKHGINSLFGLLEKTDRLHVEVIVPLPPKIQELKAEAYNSFAINMEVTCGQSNIDLQRESDKFYYQTKADGKVYTSVKSEFSFNKSKFRKIGNTQSQQEAKVLSCGVTVSDTKTLSVQFLTGFDYFLDVYNSDSYVKEIAERKTVGLTQLVDPDYCASGEVTYSYKSEFYYGIIPNIWG
jgi:hypothetical protein